MQRTELDTVKFNSPLKENGFFSEIKSDSERLLVDKIFPDQEPWNDPAVTIGKISEVVMR